MTWIILYTYWFSLPIDASNKFFALIGQAVLEEMMFEYYSILYSYFMLQQAIVQNIFPEVQIPTWQVIARGEAEGNSVSSRYLHRGENVLHYCLLKLLLPNYI